MSLLLPPPRFDKSTTKPTPSTKPNRHVRWSGDVCVRVTVAHSGSTYWVTLSAGETRCVVALVDGPDYAEHGALAVDAAAFAAIETAALVRSSARWTPSGEPVISRVQTSAGGAA